MKRLRSLMLGSLWLLLPGAAHAEGAAPEPPLGKIDLATQPPPSKVQRSFRLHDGFYFRGSVGFGSLRATFDDDHPSGSDLSGAGLSLGMDLMVGGSPSPGLALGGALLAQGAFSTEFDRGSASSEDRSLSVYLIGPFVDGFPIATQGWHLGGMIGLAGSSIEDSDSDAVSDTVGFGGAAWVGHDFWVADEWSMGPMIRATGTLTQDADSDANASTLSLLFLFTVLNH